MAVSTKKIGFFWGEEKITIVDFDKNAPVKVVNSAWGTKAAAASPFSSNLTEEIQITAILQKMLQDNQITGRSFYVSLPMKEIILRSFIIPFVKPEEIQGAIKFEAKKYMPFDIQDLSFVYHTIPFMEGTTKRLQVIFFAARKEVLARYDRIFKQVNAEVSYCEPYMVSLSKALLFQKEIKPTDHLAFLVLDKSLGRICFIDQGIPQFIREFPVKSISQTEETSESSDSLTSRIVNEVANSFDFYARQFSGERIEQMMVTTDVIQADLLATLETELKVKLTKYSPVVITGSVNQSNDMEAIFAMGACVSPPMETLADFNFLGTKKTKPKFKSDPNAPEQNYQEVILTLVVCVVILAGIFAFFQIQLKTAQKQYDQLFTSGGGAVNEPLDSIQSELQQNSDLLNQYKAIRTKSDVAYIIFKVATHLPQGAKLTDLKIAYDEADVNNPHVVIDMSGNVFKDDPNEEIAVINQIFSDFKNDKELSAYIKKVNLVSLTREMFNFKQVTGFIIHCT